MKKVVVAWGRMNPPTIGHEKLVKKVQDVARAQRGEARIYLSHTQNAKKDPLQYKDKIAMARKAFGSVVKVSQSRTLIQLMQELQKAGFTDLVMVAGSDRVREYDTLLNKYNGKDYSLDSIKVVSAGERDPDADGAAGMSATKLRQAAANGDEKTFMQGVPSRLPKPDASKLYTLIRKGLLVEEMEMYLEANKDKTKITDKDISDKELQKHIDETELDELDEEIDNEVEMMMEDDALLERAPLTLQQRIKKARTMRRLAPRLKRQRQIKKFRMAPTERLQQRARKAARNLLRKKFAGEKGAKYATLPTAQKISVDRLISTKGPMIDKIAKRMMPMIRKKEIERIRQARQGTKESFDRIDNAFNTFVEQTEKSFTELREGYKPGPNVTATRKRIEQEKERERRADARDKIRYDRKMDRARTLDTIRKNKASNPYSGTEGLDKAGIALQKKADSAGVSFEIVYEVYNRGVAAWERNPRQTTTAEQWGFARVNTFVAELKQGNVRQDADVLEEGEKPGLWDNIHKKRERIKRGSGERMRKPGSKGAPTAQDFKDAQATSENFMDGKGPGKSGDRLACGVIVLRNEKVEETYTRSQLPQIKNENLKKIRHTMEWAKIQDLIPVQEERIIENFKRQVDRIVAGKYNPIIVDCDNKIVNGHHRYEAARLLGYDEVAVAKLPWTIATIVENFADGKGPGKSGDAARHGLKGKSAAELRKIRSSDSASPRKKQLAHWMLNMHHNEEVQEDTGSVKHHQFQPTLKHGMKHAQIHKDIDVDGDVDALDRLLPDEVTGTEKNSKVVQKLMKSRGKREAQHTKLGVAFESVSLDESLQIERGAGYGTFLTAADLGMRIKAGYADHPSVEEEHGAGEEGTDKLTKKYKKETPGQ